MIDSNSHDPPVVGVACPRCQRQLVPDAGSCPHCGYQWVLAQSVEPEVAEPSSPEPPLGIAHLMAFTACIAVGFGILRAFPDPQFDDPTLYWIFLGTMGVVAGADLSGLCLFVTRRFIQRKPFPRFPGEVLLVFYSTTTLLSILPFILIIPLLGSNNTIAAEGMEVVSVVSLGICCVGPIFSATLFITAAVHATSQRWRVAFVAIAVKYALDFFLTCFVLMASFTGVLAAIAVVVAVIGDRRLHLSFPWTHWFGVSLYLGTTVVWLIVVLSMIAVQA